MLRIAIAEDHALVRKSLALLINTTDNMQVVIEASNGKELIEYLKNVSADILLLDLQMPEMDGFEAAGLIKKSYPDIKILVLTLMNDIDTIKRVIDLGVDGYFTKNTDPKELSNAILKLDENGFYFEESLAGTIKKILNETSFQTATKVSIGFTEREKDIIRLTAKELCGKEVADRLGISFRTVERHKENLIKRTGAKNFTGVIIYTLSHNLITLSEISTNG